MSGFDLRAMAQELDALKGAYVKKAYMPHYEQIVLRVNPKEAEQRDLVFVRGERIYTSKRDRPMPMTPPPFAMVLRKHLRNARLTGVKQVGFDRILAFSFDTKNGERTLYVEVFRDGNIILVDEEGIIVQPLTHASYAGRTLKKGYPTRLHHCHGPLPLRKPRLRGSSKPRTVIWSRHWVERSTSVAPAPMQTRWPSMSPILLRAKRMFRPSTVH